MKILILDDHELFGIGLSRILAEETDMNVLKVFTNPNDLPMYLKQLSPDVVLCDIRIKDVNGLDLIKQFKNQYPNIIFIVLSGYDIEDYKIRAYDYGASAFVLKDESTENLVKAIRTTFYDGRIYKKYNSKSNRLLSEKELIVLNLIAQSLTNKEIGEQLFMSKRSVEYIVSSVIKKLGVESRVGAVTQGIKLGLIE